MVVPGANEEEVAGGRQRRWRGERLKEMAQKRLKRTCCRGVPEEQVA